MTAQRGAERRTVLFDTGPDPLTLIGNAAKLGIDFGEIDAIVLSHGHFDHTGAVLAALDAIRSRKGGGRVPVYLHPLMFRPAGAGLAGWSCRHDRGRAVDRVAAGSRRGAGRDDEDRKACSAASCMSAAKSSG